MSRASLTPEQRERALVLLWAEKERLGKKSLVADRIGLGRSAVSMVMDGTYPAQSDAVLTVALAQLDRVACPYLGMEIEPARCAETSTGPAPTWDPNAMTHRRACQTCAHKPEKEC
ncbi:MAG: XRE family transcriptional regulator [Pseudomonadota bacterium]|nr:XRE family transcriptional regulator [Pseudomonadota bacterium]